jgi:ribosomal protein L23
MTEVELILIARNTEAVKNIKQLAEQTQKMYSDMGIQSKKSMGIIEKEEAIQKRLLEWRKKAGAEMIVEYNKEIEASKKRAQAYEQSGKTIQDTNEKTSQSGEKLLTSFKNWGAGLISVTTIAAGFKAVIESTDTLGDKFDATLNGWKEGFTAMARAIANNDFENFFKNVKAAVDEGQRYTEKTQEIEDAQRALEIRIDENATKIINLRLKQNDANLKTEERLKAGLEVEKLVKENAVDMLRLSEMKLVNEIQSAAFKAGYDKNQILEGNRIVQLYIRQDAELMKQIEIGKLYNIEKEKMNKLAMEASVSGVAIDMQEASIIQAKMDALGKEAEQYGKMAVGLGSITDAQKNKIKEDLKAVEAAKQSSINLIISRKNDAMMAKDLKASTEESKKANDEALKDKEEFLKQSLQLIDKHDKLEIESLSGVAKLEAQRKLGIKQIKEIRDQLAKLGTVTPEQTAMLEEMAANVWKAYYTEFKKLYENATPEELAKILKKNIDDSIGVMLDTQNESIIIPVEYQTKITPVSQDLTPDEIKKLTEKQQEAIRKGSGSVPGEPPTLGESIWSILGVDTKKDEGKKIVELAKQTADQLKGVMDDLMQKRVEDAQRRRELLDTQISEKQQELNAEVELQKQGFANNLDQKKQELEALKVQREQALKEEEKAIQRQRQIEAVSQAISLGTSIANIFRTESKLGIVGVALAIASIGAMIAAFAGAKQKVNAATKLEKGGTGTIEGKRHFEGGEPFMEAEAGEDWGVLSRPASKKYGKPFKFLVDGFNSDNKEEMLKAFNILNPEIKNRNFDVKRVEISEMRIPKITNINPRIDLNTLKPVIQIDSGANKRLDRVNSHLEDLKKKPETIIETGTSTIYIKGTSKRTVRNA